MQPLIFWPWSRWLFIFLCWFWTVPAAAQREPLDLMDAGLLALRQHPSIMIRNEGILVADDELSASKWQRFPSFGVDLNSALSRSSAAGQSSDQSGATLRIQQPLWTAGRIDAEIDGARARRAAAEIDKRQAEQDLLTKVSEVFIENQRWRERLAVAQTNVEEHRRLLELIERRSAQKVSSLADLALAKARLQQATAEQLGFEMGEQKTLIHLSELVGVQLGRKDLLSVASFGVQWPSLQEAQQAAQSHSPRLLRLNAEVSLAQADAATRRAAQYPQLLLRYEKSTGANQSTSEHRLMVVLEYQPGAGLSSFSVASAAARRITMADGAIDLGVRELQERVADIFNDWQSYSVQRDTAQQYAAATRDVMESSLRQFTAGRKTWQEVLNAQREVAQSAYASIDIVQGGILASYRLAILTGELAAASMREKKIK